MRVAVIGAGFAGLVSAKVLGQAGLDVVVFEKATDVGGVWSASRRYPGLRTQNNKGTYAFSDHPMPASYPEWPTGEQVQRYLESYVEAFHLAPHLRLGQEVVRAELSTGEDVWTVSARDVASGVERTETFDHLVVANGIFSEPFLPRWSGEEEFTQAGGRVLAVSSVHDLDLVRDKAVVVIGYGKSSCDIAVALSEAAASTHVVARQLIWKMPKKLANVLNYKYLMLTRMGEGLFRYLRPKGFERFLHGPGDGVRRSMLGSVQNVVTRQLRLRALDLVPRGSFEDIARSTVSLATDGFYEAVERGEIVVHRDMTVSRLLEKDGRGHVELSDGSLLPADLVVCGTGFTQAVPFFDETLQRRLLDERGNFQLYRQILPLDVPNLTFAGYNSSFFSPLSAEMAAVWIAARLTGKLRLPSVEVQRETVRERLRWMEERTEGHHARGTNIIPFSMHNIDEVLDELALNVGPLTRARQWLMPIDPSAYASVTPALIAR